MLFSILNAIPHIIMILKFRKKVPNTAPMYNIWHLYAGVSSFYYSIDWPEINTFNVPPKFSKSKPGQIKIYGNPNGGYLNFCQGNPFK